jgi:hypothetical protein
MSIEIDEIDLDIEDEELDVDLDDVSLMPKKKGRHNDRIYGVYRRNTAGYIRKRE